MRKVALFLSALVLLVLAIVPAVAQDGNVVDAIAPTGRAYVRFAHLAPDNSPMNFAINGSLRSAQQDIEYGEITGWFWVDAGSTEIVISPSGRSLELFGGPITIDLAADQYITFAITGAVYDGGALKLTQIEEDYSDLEEGSARVTIFDAIEDSPEISVLNGADTLTPFIYRLAYPGSKVDNDGAYTFDVVAGTYDLMVVPFDSTETFIDLSGTTFDADTFTFIALAGTAEEPEIFTATN